MDQCVFGDMCRLCLDKSDKYMNIFSEEGEQLQVKDKLTSLFPFELNADESLATNSICFNCYEIVNTFYGFYARVLTNQTYFSNSLEDMQLLKEEHFSEPPLVAETACNSVIDVDQQPDKLMYSIGPLQVDADMQDCLIKYGDALQCFAKGNSAEHQQVVIVSDSYQIDCIISNDDVINSDVLVGQPCVVDHENSVALMNPMEQQQYSEQPIAQEMVEPVVETDMVAYEESPIFVKKKFTRKKRFIKPKCEKSSLDGNGERVKRPDDMLPDHLKIRMTRAKGDAQIKEFVPLICVLCKDNYQHHSFKDLQKHFLDSHDERGYVICCDKKLYRKDRLMNHITNHINPNAFKCPYCGQNRKSKILLALHMKQHLPADERKFPCDKCSQRFVLRSQLTNHEATHFTEDQKRFVCDVCGKAFALKFVMIKHKLIHSKEKHFVCELCAKSFSSKSNLQSHMAHHSGVNQPRVQCNYCNLWYKNLDTLRTHMHRHKDKRQHICGTCNKECTTRSSLAAHIRYVHLKVREFECNICKKQFRRRLELTEHMARHTGEMLYKCPFCPKTFSSSSNYFSHRKNRHPSQFADVCKDNKLRTAEPATEDVPNIADVME